MTGRGRRRLVSLAVAVLALCLIVPVVGGGEASAATRRSPAALAAIRAAILKHGLHPKAAHHKAKHHTAKHHKKAVQRPTASTTSTSTPSSTTSTTVAKAAHPFKLRPRRVVHVRTRRATTPIATTPVSSHHKGTSLTLIFVVLLGLIPLLLLGFGLVGTDIVSRRSRTQKRKNVGIPTDV